jgi:ribosomal protein L31
VCVSVGINVDVSTGLDVCAYMHPFFGGGVEEKRARNAKKGENKRKGGRHCGLSYIVRAT